MPYVSDAQRRYFNANRQRLEAQGVDVDEWNEASKGKPLPQRAKSKDAAMQKKEALEKISRYLDYLAHRAQLSHQPLHVKQASCNNLIKLSKLLHSTGDLFASLKQVLPKSTEAQRAKLAQQLSRGAARFAKQANQPNQLPGMGPAPRAGQWRSFLPQIPAASPFAPAPAAPAAPAKPPVPAAAAKPPASAGRSFAQGAAGALGGFLGGASGFTNASRGVQALMGSGR